MPLDSTSDEPDTAVEPGVGKAHLLARRDQLVADLAIARRTVMHMEGALALTDELLAGFPAEEEPNG